MSLDIRVRVATLTLILTFYNKDRHSTLRLWSVRSQPLSLPQGMHNMNSPSIYENVQVAVPEEIMRERESRRRSIKLG